MTPIGRNAINQELQGHPEFVCEDVILGYRDMMDEVRKSVAEHAYNAVNTAEYIADFVRNSMLAHGINKSCVIHKSLHQYDARLKAAVHKLNVNIREVKLNLSNYYVNFDGATKRQICDFIQIRDWYMQQKTMLKCLMSLRKDIRYLLDIERYQVLVTKDETPVPRNSMRILTNKDKLISIY